MILLLGATGYFGQAFAKELRRRGHPFIPLTRRALDYTNFHLLFDYVRKIRPDLVINAAGFSGKPNVDACEVSRVESFQANTLLPQMVSRICRMTRTPLGHISSGCIYSGAKVLQNGELRVEKDLNVPHLRRLFETRPEAFLGYSEEDEPNFSFRSPPCSFLGGTKVLAEEALHGSKTFIWRPRMPFNECDAPGNLLSKLLRYSKIYDSIHSLSHLDDCVQACLDLWEKNAPYGIYNVTNPGAVSTRQVVQTIQKLIKPNRFFEYWINDEDFYRAAARAPRSSCILDVSKLARTGIKLRPITQALEDALRHWQPAEKSHDTERWADAGVPVFETSGWGNGGQTDSRVQAG